MFQFRKVRDKIIGHRCVKLVIHKLLISSLHRVLSVAECCFKRPLDRCIQSAVSLITGVLCPSPTKHLVCVLIMSSACNFAAGDERASCNKLKKTCPFARYRANERIVSFFKARRLRSYIQCSAFASIHASFLTCKI